VCPGCRCEVFRSTPMILPVGRFTDSGSDGECVVMSASGTLQQWLQSGVRILLLLPLDREPRLAGMPTPRPFAVVGTPSSASVRVNFEM
jgi:hypothetical protein